MVRLRIKEIAHQKGMGMGKLSRVADVNYKTVKRIYDDPTYSPTINMLERIAKALEVRIADLIEEIDDTAPR